jgi:hypothetical protein
MNLKELSAEGKGYDVNDVEKIMKFTTKFID